MNYLHYDKWESLKRELTRLFFLSIGVFLFILFFQPFPLETLDYNNRLLYVIGFGFITFILGFIVHVLVLLILNKRYVLSEQEIVPHFFVSISMLLLTTTAYAFYIRYVGNTNLTIYITFKAFLVCLIPIIFLEVLYKNKSLELVIRVLQNKNRAILLKIKEFEEAAYEEKVEIQSENNNENFSIKYSNIIIAKSADNYVKVYCLPNNILEKKIIRNTLKNVEMQLIRRSEFVRCHRTAIVNIKYIEKINRNYKGYSLILKHINEEIPVSRQYIRILKEVCAELD